MEHSARATAPAVRADCFPATSQTLSTVAVSLASLRRVSVAAALSLVARCWADRGWWLRVCRPQGQHPLPLSVCAFSAHLHRASRLMSCCEKLQLAATLGACFTRRVQAFAHGACLWLLAACTARTGAAGAACRPPSPTSPALAELATNKTVRALLCSVLPVAGGFGLSVFTEVCALLVFTVSTASASDMESVRRKHREAMDRFRKVGVRSQMPGFGSCGMLLVVVWCAAGVCSCCCCVVLCDVLPRSAVRLLVDVHLFLFCRALCLVLGGVALCAVLAASLSCVAKTRVATARSASDRRLLNSLMPGIC